MEGDCIGAEGSAPILFQEPVVKILPQHSTVSSPVVFGKAHIISLGCPKNLVDTERYVAILESQGYTLTDSLEEADLILLNTCAFIDQAKKESLAMLFEVAADKREDQRLVVAGCLVDRYRAELEAGIPEVDLWTDLNHFSEAPDEFAALSPVVLPKGFLPLSTLPGQSTNRIPWASFQRKSLTRSHSVYLKISEGCGHTCGFCSIPSFKGPQRSVPLETLLNEACFLADQGAREITLIGQDTVAYGRDLASGGSTHVRLLLERLNEIDGVEWIRVLYTYPTRLADEIEWAYRNLPKCLPYLDLPLQHLSDSVLERMRRGTPYTHIHEHVKRLREAVPQLVIRSTCIVGFPGETPKDFQLLRERFTELEVDHLGVFRYSDEEGTPALSLDHKVTQRTAGKRYRVMTEWAAEFCQERALQRVGSNCRILVDHPCDCPEEIFPEAAGRGQSWWCGRWYGQAPEIDGVVFFPSSTAQAGDFVSVQLEDVLYPDYWALPVGDA